VYSDRAEVSRLVTSPAVAAETDSTDTSPPAEHCQTIVVEGVTSDADVDSIRVRPHVEGIPCTILEVSTECKFSQQGQIDDEDEHGEDLIAARKARATLENEQKRVKAEQDLVAGYMKGMLAPVSGVSTSRPQNNSIMMPPVGTDLETLNTLLEFHAKKIETSDARLLELAEEIRAVDTKIKRLEADRATRKCSSDLKPSISISIALSWPTTAKHSDSIKLCLTYLVHSASWSPRYDLRTSLSEKQTISAQDNERRDATMSLAYFGVVRQSTGEDWMHAKISLSTASPATGGTPPAPPTRRAQLTVTQRARRGASQFQSQMNVANIPMQAMMSRRLSVDAEELSDSCDECNEIDFGTAPGASAPLAQASVTSRGAGAANFLIERRSTINADNKEHKVTITMIDITPELRYFATPDLEEKVYLQARCSNNSACPLLETDDVAIFLDGSFVAKTHLKHTFPGEAFTVFLGVDPSVKISHKLTKQEKSVGNDGGVLKSKVPTCLTNQYLSIIHNTKPTSIEMTIVQLLPRSNDDRIEVKLLEPSPRSVQDSKDRESGNVAGEGALKKNAVMQNSVTNNIVFNNTLGPGEKLELPFAYAVSWPHDAGDVEIS